MRHRKNFNPKRHRFLDKDKLIGDDRKSKTDKLFEKIKEMEKQREKKDPNATIDTRIEEAAGKATEPKNSSRSSQKKTIRSIISLQINVWQHSWIIAESCVSSLI